MEPNCIAEGDMLSSAVGWIYPMPQTKEDIPHISKNIKYRTENVKIVTASVVGAKHLLNPLICRILNYIKNRFC